MEARNRRQKLSKRFALIQLPKNEAKRLNGNLKDELEENTLWQVANSSHDIS